MADCVQEGGRLIVGDATLVTVQARVVCGLQAGSPILLGLVGPLVLAVLIDPAGLRHARFLFTLALLALLAVAVACFIASILQPSNIATVVLDRQTRMAELIAPGTFATARQLLHFDEITRFARVSAYDQDGYQTTRASMELRSGAFIELPPGVSDVHILAMQAMLERR